jgi:hypothetical protein
LQQGHCGLWSITKLIQPAQNVCPFKHILGHFNTSLQIGHRKVSIGFVTNILVGYPAKQKSGTSFISTEIKMKEVFFVTEIFFYSSPFICSLQQHISNFESFSVFLQQHINYFQEIKTPAFSIFFYRFTSNTKD